MSNSSTNEPSASVKERSQSTQSTEYQESHDSGTYSAGSPDPGTTGWYGATGEWIPNAYKAEDGAYYDFTGAWVPPVSKQLLSDKPKVVSDLDLQARIKASMAKAQLRGAVQGAVKPTAPESSVSGHVYRSHDACWDLPDDACWDWFKGSCIRGQACTWKHGEETDQDVQRRLQDSGGCQSNAKGKGSGSKGKGRRNAGQAPPPPPPPPPPLLSPWGGGGDENRNDRAKGGGKLKGKDGVAGAKGTSKKGKDVFIPMDAGSSNFCFISQTTKEPVRKPPGF